MHAWLLLHFIIFAFADVTQLLEHSSDISSLTYMHVRMRNELAGQILPEVAKRRLSAMVLGYPLEECWNKRC